MSDQNARGKRRLTSIIEYNYHEKEVKMKTPKMIEIYEVQYEEGNLQNGQSRKIEFSNWNNYIDALQTVDGIGKAMTFYPTLPRQTKADILEISERQVRYEYYNQATDMKVIGKSICLHSEANKS